MVEIWRAALSIPPRLGGKEIHVWELSLEQAKMSPVRLFYAWGNPVAVPNVFTQRLLTFSKRLPAVLHATTFAVALAFRTWVHQKRSGNIKFLHVHGDAYEAAVLATFGRASRFAPPMVLTVHGRPATGGAAKFAWGIARRGRLDYMGVSSAVKTDLRRLLGPGTRIAVQSSGVRSAFLSSTWSGPPRHVVSAGALGARRDFESLLRGLARSSSRPPIRIFGDGPDREHLQRLAAELGLDAHIAPTEEPSEIARFLASAVYLHARSRLEEGFPTSVLEALAVGTPVLTPDFAASADYLTAGHNCTLYSSEAEMAAGIDALFCPDHLIGERTLVPSWADVDAAVQAIADKSLKSEKS